MSNLLGPRPARRLGIFVGIGVGIGFVAGYGAGVFEGLVAGVAGTFALLVFSILMPPPDDPDAETALGRPQPSDPAAPNRAQRRAAAKDARRKKKSGTPRAGKRTGKGGPPPSRGR